MTYPLLPGIYGNSLGFFSEAAPVTAEDLPTLIGQAIPAGAIGCLVQAIGADILFRLDGVAPSTTVGFVFYAGQPPMFVSGAQMRALQVIQGSGGAATINVEFFS